MNYGIYKPLTLCSQGYKGESMIVTSFTIAGAVCQDDRCQTLVSKVVTIGQTRSIHCNLSCSNPRLIEWGQQGSEDQISQGPNYKIHDIRNISIGGTVYWCRCLGGDQNRQCFKILGEGLTSTYCQSYQECTMTSFLLWSSCTDIRG